MKGVASESQSGRTSCRNLDSPEKRLEAELGRLSKLCGLGVELKVVWEPGKPNNPLCGEVKGNIIHLYEPDEEEALRTLRHEYMDFLVSKTITPYKTIANTLVRILNDHAYEEKERVVEALTKLLEPTHE